MITLKVPNIAKRLLQIFLVVSFVSGCLFFILNTWVMVEGEFGPEKHPAQFTSLQIHAISAFSIMVLYGAFWGSHVFLGWRTQRSRNTGIGLTAVIGLQILTAYLLYYVAHDLYREMAMWLHLGVGLSLPLWLTLHIRAAKKRAVKQPQARKKPEVEHGLRPALRTAAGDQATLVSSFAHNNQTVNSNGPQP